MYFFSNSVEIEFTRTLNKSKINKPTSPLFYINSFDIPQSHSS
jgi:hypothetical protein